MNSTFACTACSLDFSSLRLYSLHILANPDLHLKVFGNVAEFECKLCSVQCNSASNLRAHLQGKLHMKLTNQQSVTKPTIQTEAKSEHHEVLGTAAVDVLSDTKECDQWIQQHIINTDCSHIGFDTESKPAFNANMVQQLSVVQIATPNRCLVFRVFNLKHNEWPVKLVYLLQSTRIAKYVVDIRGDVALLNNVKVVPKGFIDVQLCAVVEANTEHREGIVKLAQRFLDLDHAKPKKIATSNWSKWPLTAEQVQYAAMDAIIALRVATKLKLATDTAEIAINKFDQVCKQAQELMAATKRARRAERKAQKIFEDAQNEAREIYENWCNPFGGNEGYSGGD